jgi:DNA-binding transcriptional LysR family regulator
MRDELSDFVAFSEVAQERSFTAAARRLKVSTSALSRAIRGLEERVGVRLLARTTRSVAPTEAGERLLSHLRPAFSEVRTALEELGELRSRPAGTVRLLMPPTAASVILWPKLRTFTRKYADVSLDVTIDDSRLDLVAERFDAGIHLGEFIQQDMVVTRVSRDQRAAIVGAPSYFKRHPIPKTPRELTEHECIGYRLGTAGIYRWEFEKRGKELTVDVTGPLVVDDMPLMIRAALDGLGLAFVAFEECVSAHIQSRRPVRVLEDWCVPFPGFFLYYPSRRHQPPGLAALIDALRM